MSAQERVLSAARPDTPAEAPAKRVPDFFVVGHPKSGTTALNEMLSRHPRISMCTEKEPWYFSPELRFRAPPREPFAVPETLEQYLSLFEVPGPGQLVGEASTTYLWSQSAAGLIAAARPDARIIAILREPASFLRSLHLQYVQAHIESELDLRRALGLQGARAEGRGVPDHTYLPQMLQYSEHVRYVEQLRRYHAVFPREQVLVLIYDDFRDDNEATLHEVLRFLSVEESPAIEAVEANESLRPRSQVLHEAVHALAVGRGPLSRTVKAAVKATVPAGPRRRLLGALRRRLVYAPPHPADERLTEELRERFRPEVESLSEYLGRDLIALWRYA